MSYAKKWNKAKGVYRKVFGHKSPYRRIYGGRNPGEALDVTMKEVGKIKGKMKEMKERLNVEKKHIDEVHTEILNVGQLRYDGQTNSIPTSGHQVMDVTPEIAQGVDYDERTGNSLKFTGFNFKIQMNGQSNTHTARRVRFTLVRMGCVGATPAETFEKIFDPNPLSSVTSLEASEYYAANPQTQPVYDLQAPLNYTQLKTMGIHIIAKRTFYLPGKTFHDSGDSDDELIHKNASFSVKLKDVARYDGSNAVLPENVRYYLFIQCDAGNSSAGTIDRTQTQYDYPVTAPFSGVVVRYHSRIWYVDN
jgi:hypothetical protein